MPSSRSAPSPMPRGTVATQISTEKTTLRLTIDGAWTVTDMVNSFAALRDVYNLILIFRRERLSQRQLRREQLSQRQLRRIGRVRGIPRRKAYRGLTAHTKEHRKLLNTKKLDSIESLISPRDRLTVARVNYGSLGLKDILGAGEIIGHVRSLTEKIIDLCTTTRERKIKGDLLEAELAAKRIENARAVVTLARDLGYSETEIRETVDWVDRRQVALSRLVGEGKILAIETLHSGALGT